MTILFLDTEFSDFIHSHLLSIGLSDGSELEFYAELDLARRDNAPVKKIMSSFVKQIVVPQFKKTPHVYPDIPTIGERLYQWLKNIPGTIDIAYDYHTDFDLLEKALRKANRWDAIRERLNAVHVAYVWGEPSAKEAATREWTEQDLHYQRQRHHALADARALAKAFFSLHPAQHQEKQSSQSIDPTAE
jgi:hypothetical protein